jgi:hypothetical protein
MSAMRPILLRDACVVTMHPALGDLSRGAVLIEGDRIAAVAPTSRRVTPRRSTRAASSSFPA